MLGFPGVGDEFRIIRVEGGYLGVDQAAEEAIFKGRYKPATKGGIKVRVWVSIRMPFKIE